MLNKYNETMENYINNLLFTYLPHISMAVFWFGLITRIVKASKSIQANSSQFLSRKGLRLGSNLFHFSIIFVFIGHFTVAHGNNVGYDIYYTNSILIRRELCSSGNMGSKDHHFST